MKVIITSTFLCRGSENFIHRTASTTLSIFFPLLELYLVIMTFIIPPWNNSAIILYNILMFKTEFVTRVCAVILGLNIGGWAISVGVSPVVPKGIISIPITPSGIQAESLSAGVSGAIDASGPIAPQGQEQNATIVSTSSTSSLLSSQ